MKKKGLITVLSLINIIFLVALSGLLIYAININRKEANEKANQTQDMVQDNTEQSSQADKEAETRDKENDPNENLEPSGSPDKSSETNNQGIPMVAIKRSLDPTKKMKVKKKMKSRRG